MSLRATNAAQSGVLQASGLKPPAKKTGTTETKKAETTPKGEEAEEGDQAAKTGKQQAPTRGKQTRGRRKLVRKKRRYGGGKPGGTTGGGKTGRATSVTAQTATQRAQQAQEAQQQQQTQQTKGNEPGKHMARRKLNGNSFATRASVMFESSNGPQKGPQSRSAKQNFMLRGMLCMVGDTHGQLKCNPNDKSPLYSLRDLRKIKGALTSLACSVKSSLGFDGDGKKSKDKKTGSGSSSGPVLTDAAYKRESSLLARLALISEPPPERPPELGEPLEMIA